MKSLILKIITPERIVLEAEVSQVTLPIQDGEITVLPEHIPHIGALRAGEIVLRKESAQGEEIALAVSGGFTEFHDNTMTVLADTAERADEIDIARAEEARKRAEELMQQTVREDDEEYVRTAAALEKELARIRVARRHHSKRTSYPETMS